MPQVANVTPCQCQKNANRGPIWMLAQYYEGEQFLTFLWGNEKRNKILPV